MESTWSAPVPSGPASGSPTGCGVVFTSAPGTPASVLASPVPASPPGEGRSSIQSARHCTEPSAPTAQTSGSYQILVQIVGPFPTDKTPAVSFGPLGTAAYVQRVEPASVGTTRLLVTPPEAGFFGPSTTVAMAISTLEDASVSVLAPFTFRNAPSVLSARLDTYGTQILVLFDQPTNVGSGSASGSATDLCGTLIAASSLQLMSQSTALSPPTCTWTSASTLVVALGPGATIAPGCDLSLLAGQIRSSDGISPLMEKAMVPVLTPSLLLTPTITIAGPATIDPCASLTVYASGVSPRALKFVWSCSNDEALHQFLQALPPTSVLQLTAGTPLMPTLDKTYQISVRAVDFFGTSSAPQKLSVLKKSSAAPLILFSPSSVSVVRDQALQLAGVAQFSSCPIARNKLHFRWIQVPVPETCHWHTRAHARTQHARTHALVFVPPHR